MHAGTPRRISASAHKPLASVDNAISGNNVALGLILEPCGLNLDIGWTRHVVQDVVMELVMQIYVELVDKRLAQKLSVAIAIMLTLKNQMMTISRGAFASFFALSHIITPLNALYRPLRCQIARNYR